MSTYGRSYDAVVNVLEAFGIDPEQTNEKWYRRNEQGEKELPTLATLLTEAAYDNAFNMGERVATLRMTKHIESVMMPRDRDQAQPT